MTTIDQAHAAVQASQIGFPLATPTRRVDDAPMPAPARIILTKGLLAALFEKYRAEMHLAAWGKLGNDADAKDAVQNAFLSFLVKPRTCRQDKLRAFLCRVASNQARNIIRSRQTQHERPNRGRPLTEEQIKLRHKRHRPAVRPADVVTTVDPPQRVNPRKDPEVFTSPVLACLLRRLNNKPAMLRALKWTLKSNPATRKQKDLSRAAKVSEAAVSPIIHALCTEALLAYKEVYGALPAVRLTGKKSAKAIRKLLATAKKVGRHGQNH